MRTLTVNLGDRSYPIYLGEGLLPRTGELLKQVGSGGMVGVVTNPKVAELYLRVVEKSLTRSGFRATPILVPDGEEHKNLNSLSAIHDRLISERFDRRSSLIALGGGVIGDLAGFAAATFLRGLPYIQIPTTLLAQVDASVGGKTGINHREGKNLIGAFYQPRLVLIDLGVLETLPRRELVAGLAEVIKYGIIEDPELFSFLEENLESLLSLDRDTLEKAIASSCAIKARVVEKDEREDDYRSVLNFGHTIGHALESLTGYESFLHGEAVGIGMAQAASVSGKEGFCDDQSLKRIQHLVKRAGLPTELPSGIRLEELVKKMEVDKKSVEGKIKFVLCAGIGRTHFHWLSPEEILAELSPQESVTTPKTQPSSPSELVDLAESFRQEGRLHEALEAVERSLQENPRNPRALLLQGRILYLTGKYARALQVLDSLEPLLGRDERLKKITADLGNIWQEPHPKTDPTFITETMAELHIKQGYLWEAMEIYRQLYLASRREERLWRKILDLKDRLEREGSRETPGGTFADRLEALNHWIQNQRRGS